MSKVLPKGQEVITSSMIYELSDHLCAKGGLFFRANKTLKNGPPFCFGPGGLWIYAW